MPNFRLEEDERNKKAREMTHFRSYDAAPVDNLGQWWDKVKTGQMAREGLERMVTNPEQTAMDWVSPLGKVAGMLGVTAFHGSPYKFDKFRLDKIGTGEGAQAYGYGLYFAEQPAVAKSYSGTPYHLDFSNFEKGKIDPDAFLASGQISIRHGDIDKTMSELLSSSDKTANRIGRWIQNNRKNLKVIEPQGNLYKVDIPDEAVNKMLDWDKQLPKKHRNLAWDLPPNATGKDLYEYLRKTMDDQQITEALREAGIPGIKYLDQGSRESGKGTFNYVVFDENLPKILESK